MALGTKEDPWLLTTAPGTSTYSMYRDADPAVLVCQVGSTTPKYHARAVEDLHAWLTTRPDWVPLGAADEKKAAAPGTVEACGHSRRREPDQLEMSLEEKLAQAAPKKTAM